MDDNLTTLLILAVSIVGAVTLMVLIAWMRMRQAGIGKAGAEAVEKVERLTAENQRLEGEVGGLKKRLAVLEQIATDPAERTAREIEQLR